MKNKHENRSDDKPSLRGIIRFFRRIKDLKRENEPSVAPTHQMKHKLLVRSHFRTEKIEESLPWWGQMIGVPAPEPDDNDKEQEHGGHQESYRLTQRFYANYPTYPNEGGL